MSLIIEDRPVNICLNWCLYCNRCFSTTELDPACLYAEAHFLVPIYVEADPAIDMLLSEKDFGEGD